MYDAENRDKIPQEPDAEALLKVNRSRSKVTGIFLLENRISLYHHV